MYLDSFENASLYPYKKISSSTLVTISKHDVSSVYSLSIRRIALSSCAVDKEYTLET